jgi:hypothetical protein
MPISYIDGPPGRYIDPKEVSERDLRRARRGVIRRRSAAVILKVPSAPDPAAAGPACYLANQTLAIRLAFQLLPNVRR